MATMYQVELDWDAAYQLRLVAEQTLALMDALSQARPRRVADPRAHRALQDKVRRAHDALCAIPGIREGQRPTEERSPVRDG